MRCALALMLNNASHGVATADDLLTELGPSRASHDERAPLPTHAVSHVGHLLELCEQN